MSQKRYFNMGASGDSAKQNEVHNLLYDKVILDGGELYVSDAHTLAVAPYKIVFGNGFVIEEEEIQYITVPTGVPAVSYTVIATHVDNELIGGIAATVSIINGIHTVHDDSVVLGWLIYTGFAVPLDDSMVFSNTDRKRMSNIVGGDSYFLNSPLWDTYTPGLYVSVDAGILSTTHPGTDALRRIFTRYTAQPALDGNVLMTWNVMVKESKYRVFELFCTRHAVTPATAILQLYGSDGVVIPAGDLDRETVEDIPNATMTFRIRTRNVSTLVVGQQVTLTATVTVAMATTLDVYWLKATTSEYLPFA